jgi:hypothetical protein
MLFNSLNVKLDKKYAYHCVFLPNFKMIANTYRFLHKVFYFGVICTNLAAKIITFDNQGVIKNETSTNQITHRT